MIRLSSSSADDTRAIAAAIAGVLEPGDVVVLDGGLGAGKTTFVQGAVAGLGSAAAVTSPTFA
ncbi:MAG TPA: tRNA (adenosine(37)-N6)-threonylcarbamoyltransferase complex ATPase subunit type 1 TsaE, partial [Acidimicrobiia bacterium]